MTVNQKNCCKLLYDFLDNNISEDEISESAIECAIETIVMYNNINNKKTRSPEEKNFLNDCFYSNELSLIKLIFKINQHVENRKRELVSFIELFNEYNESESFRVKAYKQLPFRNSDFKKEMIIFNRYFNTRFDSYYNLLLKLYESIQQRNNNIFTLVPIFLKNEKIGFTSFNKESNDNTKYAIHPKELYLPRSDLYKLLESDHIQCLKKVYNKRLGQYAETIVYENEIRILEQCGRKDLASKVVFVSRDIGDGLGYDILSFDPITGEEKLIEAKGTEQTKLITDEIKKDNDKNTIDMTYNEMRKMDNCNYGNDKKLKKHYYIYVVFFQNHHPVSVHQIKDIDNHLVDQYNNEFLIETEFKDDLHHEVNKYKVKLKKPCNNLYKL